MTDNEIIKAFECCYLYDVMFCDKCPNKDTCGEIDVGESVLDLINRLNSEKSALVEHLKKARRQLKTAKSEAVKEFVEAYKDQIKNYTGMFTDEGFYVSLDAVLNAVDFVCERLSEEMG